MVGYSLAISALPCLGSVLSEEEARRLAARKNALNRFGKPEELANAIVFLCSDRASYITGISLNLDGGRLKGLW